MGSNPILGRCVFSKIYLDIEVFGETNFLTLFVSLNGRRWTLSSNGRQSHGIEPHSYGRYLMNHKSLYIVSGIFPPLYRSLIVKKYL